MSNDDTKYSDHYLKMLEHRAMDISKVMIQPRRMHIRISHEDLTRLDAAARKAQRAFGRLDFSKLESEFAALVEAAGNLGYDVTFVTDKVPSIMNKLQLEAIREQYLDYTIDTSKPQHERKKGDKRPPIRKGPQNRRNRW